MLDVAGVVGEVDNSTWAGLLLVNVTARLPPGAGAPSVPDIGDWRSLPIVTL
jgi:hypothetical protein